MNDSDVWPAGQTWVFQGTVAEDATAGTHVCSLVVTPGAMNELEVLYANITVGNTATAQLARAQIDDGVNIIANIFNGSGTTSTNASASYDIPNNGTTVAIDQTANLAATNRLLLSGTMRLKMLTSTAAVSVTQVFAVACRIRGPDTPSATLADTVGTPTLTANTNATF